MFIKTKIFGDVEISDDKILTFEDGIIGFPDLKHFTLIHDEEKGKDAGIRYFQSIEEPAFAMPVMNPLMVCEDYNPQVSEEFLSSLGNISDENIVVLVTVTVPTDLTKMTVNLKGPFIINVAGMKASQTIIDNDEYPVKYPIYDILQKNKENA